MTLSIHEPDRLMAAQQEVKRLEVAIEIVRLLKGFNCFDRQKIEAKVRELLS